MPSQNATKLEYLKAELLPQWFEVFRNNRSLSSLSGLGLSKVIPPHNEDPLRWGTCSQNVHISIC